MILVGDGIVMKEVWKEVCRMDLYVNSKVVVWGDYPVRMGAVSGDLGRGQ
jgi:hypothetical protein